MAASASPPPKSWQAVRSSHSPPPTRTKSPRNFFLSPSSLRKIKELDRSSEAGWSAKNCNNPIFNPFMSIQFGKDVKYVKKLQLNHNWESNLIEICSFVEKPLMMFVSCWLLNSNGKNCKRRGTKYFQLFIQEINQMIEI